MKRTTEQASNYHHLDRMSTAEIIEAINAEDRTVPVAVAQAVPRIEEVVRDNGVLEAPAFRKKRRGGRSRHCACRGQRGQR